MRKNSASFAIRAFQSADIEAVMEVWNVANALAHPFLPPEFVAETAQAIRHIYLPKAETYVAEKAGDIIGFIALIGNEIGGLFLHPGYHGCGYGWALVDHAVALKGPLTVEVFRDNELARPFYQSYGFELIGEVIHPASDQMSWKMAMPGA